MREQDMQKALARTGNLQSTAKKFVLIGLRCELFVSGVLFDCCSAATYPLFSCSTQQIGIVSKKRSVPQKKNGSINPPAS
jgi:hypothetical protein